jgi:hypothetical protein
MMMGEVMVTQCADRTMHTLILSLDESANNSPLSLDVMFMKMFIYTRGADKSLVL